MSAVRYPRVAALKDAQAFAAHLASIGASIGFDPELAPPAASPLARPFEHDGVRVGNRFCVLPMEGWDGTADGAASDLTRRRWQHFGESGAKLMWGGEAVAIRHDGRANPRQLVISERTERSLADLRTLLVSSHVARFGANAADDLFIGLQLTHSGRFAKPNLHERPEPLVAYANPVLDRRFAHGVRVLTDQELDLLIDDYINAARIAWRSGYQFVDVKHCHGYLGHELLSGRTRPGRYGGSFENRTRFLRSVIEGIRANVPGLRIGVRLSAVDTVPFRRGSSDVGEPEVAADRYPHAFGLIQDGSLDRALDDSRGLLALLRTLEVKWVCVTAGTPYYNPHLLRPALFPPSDGYQPPEDPLLGVARHLAITAALKAEFPDIAFIGSGYTYLQEWLPLVAQHQVRLRRTDFVGLGRIILAYPDLPADLLAGRPLRRRSICRTFSDCTTGPRLGLVSGCYPLDAFYGAHPDAAPLKVGKALIEA